MNHPKTIMKHAITMGGAHRAAYRRLSRSYKPVFVVSDDSTALAMITTMGAVAFSAMAGSIMTASEPRMLLAAGTFGLVWGCQRLWATNKEMKLHHRAAATWDELARSMMHGTPELVAYHGALSRDMQRAEVRALVTPTIVDLEWAEKALD